jgi:hypothetical protein
VVQQYRVLVNGRQARPISRCGNTQRGFSMDPKGSIVVIDFGREGVRQLSNQRKERCHMAIESHLAELEKRHEALKLAISEALTHPSIDDLEIAELKRRKLSVKDEIMRLKQDTLVH